MSSEPLTRTEWAVRWTAVPGDYAIEARDSRDSAEAVIRLHGFGGATLVSRTVTYGPWTDAP